MTFLIGMLFRAGPISFLLYIAIVVACCFLLYRLFRRRVRFASLLFVLAAILCGISVFWGLTVYQVMYPPPFYAIPVFGGFLLLFALLAWLFTPKARALVLWKRGILLLLVIAILGGDGYWAWTAHKTRHPPHTRCRVGRAMAEIRNLAVNLEDYYIDHNVYPPAVDKDGNPIPFDYEAGVISAGFVPWMLTTPKAYVYSLPPDPFRWGEGGLMEGYRYATNGVECWIVTSRGPDRDDDIPIEKYPSPEGGACKYRSFMSHFGGIAIEYDSSNGVLSSGDVLRVGP